MGHEGRSFSALRPHECLCKVLWSRTTQLLFLVEFGEQGYSEANILRVSGLPGCSSEERVDGFS